MSYEKGCVMAKVNSNKIAEMLELIPDDILYKPEDEQYGKEKDSHVTILYGIMPGVDEERVSEVLKIEEVERFNIMVSGASLFENEEFDVVKLDVHSLSLHEMNKELRFLPYENDYPEYHPHITLAYVKKGSFNCSNIEAKRALLEVKEVFYSKVYPDPSDERKMLNKKFYWELLEKK